MLKDFFFFPAKSPFWGRSYIFVYLILSVDEFIYFLSQIGGSWGEGGVQPGEVASVSQGSYIYIYIHIFLIFLQISASVYKK